MNLTVIVVVAILVLFFAWALAPAVRAILSCTGAVFSPDCMTVSTPMHPVFLRHANHSLFTDFLKPLKYFLKPRGALHKTIHS